MSLIDFLKTHTKVSNKFIDDFFSLYDPKDKYNFSIDVENISKWMGIVKGEIKETLLRTYIENTDYTIKKETAIGKVGKPKEIILVTPKCFKLMAMQSRSKKASTVREYYYELEQVLDQYKEYIIQGLKDKITKLENNQKPKINPSKGVIYVLQAADGTGHYKIGEAKNLKKRMSQYNGDKIYNVTPVFVYETNDMKAIEKCVKTYGIEFQYGNKGKEMYKIDIDILKNLIADCAEFNDKTRLKYAFKPKNPKGNLYIALSDK